MQNFSHIAALVLLGFAIFGLLRAIADLKFYGQATGEDSSNKSSKT